MIGFMPFRLSDKYINNYVHSYQQMDPMFVAGNINLVSSEHPRMRQASGLSVSLLKDSSVWFQPHIVI